MTSVWPSAVVTLQLAGNMCVSMYIPWLPQPQGSINRSVVAGG